MSPSGPSDAGSTGDEVHETTIEESAARIDRALAAVLPLSRTRIQALIEGGRVAVDGVAVERASEPVAAGARVVVRVPPPAEPTIEPEPIPLDVLFEDDDCLVVDKPPGLVVHPAPGHPSGTLVNALLHLRPDVSGVGGERKAGIVHRLDKDTSGCLLVAKNDAAHRALADQFAERTVEKTYWAFTWGRLPGEEGVFDEPVGRSTVDRQKMSVRPRKGRRAVTRWRVVERYAVGEWLELSPETGRTHQLRVHLSAAGHPVIGDDRYGGGVGRARGFHGPQQGWARAAAGAAPRQALHARALAFDRPSGERVEVVSPLPDDLERLREVLREHRQ